MTHSVDTSQPLSSATSVIAQWAHEQSGHSGRDGGYAWAQWHGLVLTTADLAMATAECSVCYLHWVPIWHPSPGWSASYLLTGWLHWTTSIMEGAAFCSYWNRHSGNGFAFPACSASAKNAIHRHIECFIHCHGIHTALLLIKELNLQQMKCDNGPCSWNSLVLPCFPSSWGSWLHRMVEWPLEDSVIVPARWQHLVGLGQCSPGGSMCSVLSAVLP